MTREINDTWGRPRPSRIRRALGLAKPTWHDRHPLPEGWRPRTRIDVYGRAVEPWQYLVSDPRGYPHDGGEHWLPVGFDPDQAAYEVMGWWLEHTAPEYLETYELPGLRCSVRHGTAGARIGVAYASEQALTA